MCYYDLFLAYYASVLAAFTTITTVFTTARRRRRLALGRARVLRVALLLRAELPRVWLVRPAAKVRPAANQPTPIQPTQRLRYLSLSWVPSGVGRRRRACEQILRSDVQQLDAVRPREFARALAGRQGHPGPQRLAATARSHCSAPNRYTSRAPSHRRFVLPPIHFIRYSITYSVPLFLKRQCDRTLC